MELPSVEGGEIALPINSTYGGGHMMHHESAPHNHTVPSSVHQMQITNGPSMLVVPAPPSSMEDTLPYKKNKKMSVKYRECLKNHAASMGGNATDGCGEFMPSGEEGTIEALTCSACNCHRNFHRKEIEGEPHPHPTTHPHIPTSYDCNYYTAPPHLNRVSLGNGKNVIFQGHHQKGILGTESCGYNHNNVGALVPSRAPPPLIMSYNMGIGSLPSESDEHEDGGGFMSRHPPAPAPPHQLVKKRFRTKFTQEQKEKMLNFAEKVGWKIQKQEECVVQQFCQEVGIKRRVLKVWMHNNKHNLAKKMNSNVSNINPQNQINYENA